MDVFLCNSRQTSLVHWLPRRLVPFHSTSPQGRARNTPRAALVLSDFPQDFYAVWRFSDRCFKNFAVALCCRLFSSSSQSACRRQPTRLQRSLPRSSLRLLQPLRYRWWFQKESFSSTMPSPARAARRISMQDLPIQRMRPDRYPESLYLRRRVDQRQPEGITPVE